MSLPLNAAGLTWLQGRRAKIQEELDRCVEQALRHEADVQAAIAALKTELTEGP